jgi:cell division protein FtsB
VSQDNPAYNQILASLEELESVCRSLKQENAALKSKVSKLESSLVEAKSNTTIAVDASLMSDNDRIAVRNQIQTYIKRIDDILEETA